MSLERVNKELEKTLQLLKLEKRTDLEQYKRSVAGTSLKERRKQGVCWYPVQLERTRFNSAERLIVKVTRNREHKESNAFQSGKLVSLFATGGDLDESNNHVHGVVNKVTEREMYITLNKDRLPEWVNHGFIGVQLLFDENSYKEMELALNNVINDVNPRIKELKQLLVGSWGPRFEEMNPSINPLLNDSQNNALHKVVSAKDVAIIHGPPGTGKTTTMVQAIVQVLKKESQVLVTAPSNAAVDLMVEKLAEQGVSVVRIGHPARVTEEILGQTLDAKITQHKDFSLLKDLRKRSDELFRLGGKYKRNFGQSEREQRKLLLAEARSIKDEADHLSFYISSDVLSNSQVIATTLVGANHQKVKGLKFSTCFIDEAGQALEPAAWIPIVKSNRVIFAGDHKQLPPTIKSFEAGKDGLSETLFEKVISRKQVDVLLKEQYRMNEKIMGFSNELFYKNELLANEKVRDWKVFEDDKVVEFIDTAGCGFYEQVDSETRSSFNKEEADLVIKKLKIYHQVVKENTNENFSIGIISPYKAQANLINDLLGESEFDEVFIKSVSVNTVDSFQGQEKDVVIISLVRSNDQGKIGFLSDYRRLNVALTRAKKKLIVIGDSATISSDSVYSAFLDYINSIDAYSSAYEILYA